MWSYGCVVYSGVATSYRITAARLVRVCEDLATSRERPIRATAAASRDTAHVMADMDR